MQPGVEIGREIKVLEEGQLAFRGHTGHGFVRPGTWFSGMRGTPGFHPGLFMVEPLRGRKDKIQANKSLQIIPHPQDT